MFSMYQDISNIRWYIWNILRVSIYVYIVKGENVMIFFLRNNSVLEVEFISKGLCVWVDEKETVNSNIFYDTTR